MTFSARYLTDIDRRFDLPRRYEVKQHASSCDVFGHGVRLFGAGTAINHGSNETLRTKLNSMPWYVLNNHDEVKTYIQYVLTSLLLNFMLPYTL